MLIHDGAAASAQMDGNGPAVAVAAKAAATRLIDLACGKRSSRK
jgi:hypothetical protein